MSDEIPSPRVPMDEDMTDTEIEEAETMEMTEADDLLDAETDVPEEIDGDITETDVDDAEIADSEG